MEKFEIDDGILMSELEVEARIIDATQGKIELHLKPKKSKTPSQADAEGLSLLLPVAREILEELRAIRKIIESTTAKKGKNYAGRI